MSGTLVVIPARLAASRLPRKPLADICGSPMIIHVLQRAREADVGPVVVATDSVEIADVVASSGGQAVMTSERHQSGSDRIYEAVNLYDAAGQADVIVNLQGDLPTVEPEVVRAAARLLSDPAVDIGTVAAQIRREEEHFESAVVKAVGYLVTPNRLRALYFTRATAPWGEGPRYHHIGLYAYRRSALQRFVALGPSSLEQREKLEQLRALENNMRIDVAIVDGVPLGVDTPSDLERARELLSGQKRDAPHGT